jgi:hypothetical protein
VVFGRVVEDDDDEDNDVDSIDGGDDMEEGRGWSPG